MPGMYEMLVILIIFVFPAIMLLPVIPFWVICKKAGFPETLSLLMLVPGVNFVLPFYIAFAEWPAHRQNVGSGQ